ncbi:unnamed protein product [Blepharisma stoltei]|uniref:LITAF domain-containing protein n=1 Tax=Blepharisma stoltei TaxID=1481888 RepID=A0AAU9K4V5_9CILI|nr:unnamed protein product [Blepharisma stoltei]
MLKKENQIYDKLEVPPSSAQFIKVKDYKTNDSSSNSLDFTLAPTACNSPLNKSNLSQNHLNLPFEMQASYDGNSSTARNSTNTPLITTSRQGISTRPSLSFLSSDLSVRISEKLRKLREEFENFDISFNKPDNAIDIRIPEEFPESLSKLPIQAIPMDYNDPYEIDLQSSVPQLKWCAYCQAERTSEIEYVNTSKTFWSSVAVFLAGGVFGCFMVPYMMNSCKGRKLRCNKCKHNF